MSLPAIKPANEMRIIVVFGLSGILAVAYGMMMENHPIFIIGLILVVMAYLLIRRRLKTWVRDKG
jgi:hypothetical protein